MLLDYVKKIFEVSEGGPDRELVFSFSASNELVAFSFD